MPYHLQRRFLISSSAGSWFVFCHSSLLLMVSGQWICKILRRQLLMKTSTFLVMEAVVLQVSAPYKRTALTSVLKILTLVLTDSSLDLQMFRSCINAVCAFPIRALMSASLSVPLSPLFIDNAAQLNKGIHLLQSFSVKHDWVGADCVSLEDLTLALMDVEAYLCRGSCYTGHHLLHLLLGV